MNLSLVPRSINSLQLENTLDNPRYVIDSYSFIPLRSISSIERTQLEKSKLLLIVGILLILGSLSALLTSQFSPILILTLGAGVTSLYRYLTTPHTSILTIYEHGSQTRKYFGTSEEVNAMFNSLLNAMVNLK